MEIVYLMSWTPYMHHIVQGYTLYLPIYHENALQLMEWLRCHKFMYVGLCATNICAKSHIKEHN